MGENLPKKSSTALSESEIQKRFIELGESWTLVSLKGLKKAFTFPNQYIQDIFIKDLDQLEKNSQHHLSKEKKKGGVLLVTLESPFGPLTYESFVLAEKIDALYICRTGDSSVNE